MSLGCGMGQHAPWSLSTDGGQHDRRWRQGRLTARPSACGACAVPFRRVAPHDDMAKPGPSADAKLAIWFVWPSTRPAIAGAGECFVAIPIAQGQP